MFPITKVAISKEIATFVIGNILREKLCFRPYLTLVYFMKRSILVLIALVFIGANT
ncbi:Uncharacterised protein [Sphingobacterium multivorum]|uniref:Uncharacterized protein n=1 Tax=Sphingobacterium multivorum TaxID=28454 RepID=A0A2X2IP07_SPHMU|nr:Uncharacterised protein [Sphingobacterium multivorum]